MSDIQTALEAMRSDAKIWDNAGEDLQAPRSAAGRVTITGADVSMWAADRGLHATYESARAKLEDLLRQAADNFHSMADALRDSADTYQREEEANMHKFDSTY